jgi:cytochrome b subunit of formate dehydrogenase/DnaJ-class molecular chaperone
VIDADTCLACHGDPSADRFIDPAKFQASIHGVLSCTSCHADVTGIPHETPLKPVSCSACHQLEAEVYLNSDHGLALKHGVSEAASCQDCHGSPHELRNSRDPASPVFRANLPQTCAKCHGKSEEMAKFHLGQAAPIASYAESVHGIAFLQKGNTSAAVCTDCHGSHDLHRATSPTSKLYWQRIPETCGKCHDNIRQTFLRSVHGRAISDGKRDAPVCTDCHGEHAIAGVKTAASKVSPAHIPETCGQCHGAERITTKYRLPAHVVETYMESFHGLALQLGSVTAANCASCHGTHDILPSADPRSSVYPTNLAQTCGKCHAGVSAQVARGQIHSGTRPGLEHRVVSFVRRFYLILIILVIGGMFVHNLLDFLKKFQAHYARMAAVGVRPRMSLNVRLQHGVLTAAFLVLAYTGFALKSPQAWWASPFIGRVDWRGLGHRLAAVLFAALALYHLGYILFTSRGRHHVRALMPRRADLLQPFQMLAYYVGLRRERPVFARYSYIEKAEYWALVWGSVIMTLTGALMTWEGWTLRLFPKWFFDAVTAVHYYEAILACLAILVWHFYFVIFDPDEYPMKWTWITGQPSAADQAHRKDDPHARPEGRHKEPS